MALPKAPASDDSDWFNVIPKRAPLLRHGVIGVNTVGSSLRHGPRGDLRGDVPNPKIFVNPWLNSTIEPDTNIKDICNPL
jgi:hypothetical protein